MDDLKARGTKAFLWDFFGKLARHGTSFIVIIFLARLLEPSEFGLIAMIMVIIALALIFTDVGLGSALIQRRRLLPIHYASVFYFNLVSGALLTVITFLCAPWISAFYGNEQLIPITQTMSFLFLINAFSSMQVSKLKKELNYAALTKADVSAALLSGAISIGLAFYGAGVWSLVAQALLRGVLYNIVIWTLAKWIPSFTFSFKALRQLWGFGFRMFLSGILESIFTHLDIIIIGKLFSPAVLGFFDQAKRLDALIVQYSSGSIMAVLFPILSRVQNDLPRFRHISIKTMELISFAVFLLLGGMYLISEELIVILFTEKWLPAVGYFQILILSGFGYPISALLVNILKGRGDSKTFLRLEIYKKIFLSVNLYVGFMWGIEGYLYGLIIVSALGVYLNMYFAAREIGLSVLDFAKTMIIQMMIALSAVWMVLLLCGDLELHDLVSLLLKGVLFTLLYVALGKMLKTDAYTTVTAQVAQYLQQKKG